MDRLLGRRRLSGILNVGAALRGAESTRDRVEALFGREGLRDGWRERRHQDCKQSQNAANLPVEKAKHG